MPGGTTGRLPLEESTDIYSGKLIGGPRRNYLGRNRPHFDISLELHAPCCREIEMNLQINPQNVYQHENSFPLIQDRDSSYSCLMHSAILNQGKSVNEDDN
ncbi:hypothetical protein I7I51_06578 [Histoplasma capsulatum]|uniref:Uncharacterized protein n=1 Tax=Ajellomyces capsulatus TaxID=5037 RepID=A0A8A1MKS9_AJECA|nr:hypothetical protein I7I51_06578 [Histoplasma capsulatum]